jgi:ABC-type branched-subunit amino acid transport system ATPase component
MSLLEAHRVSKSFGGIRALDACSITVEEGTIAGLIGPNGSGKTTLFNVMTGYERVDAGDIRFRGTSIANATPDRIFGLGIGRTFQLTRIFPRLSVIENMHVAVQRKGSWGYGGLPGHKGPARGLDTDTGQSFWASLLSRWSSSAEQQRALELLDFVGIVRLKDMPAGNLSYGQKKLLEFAFILIAEPQVILLDEPAGGVNPTMINHLEERIRLLNRRGVTFLIVEHNMEFVMRLCDTVTVIHQGCKVAEGPPAQVRKDPAVLAAYLGT